MMKASRKGNRMGGGKMEPQAEIAVLTKLLLYAGNDAVSKRKL